MSARPLTRPPRHPLDNTSDDPRHRAPLILGHDLASVTDKVASIVEQKKPPRAWYIAFAIASSGTLLLLAMALFPLEIVLLLTYRRLGLGLASASHVLAHSSFVVVPGLPLAHGILPPGVLLMSSVSCGIRVVTKTTPTPSPTRIRKAG